VKKTINYKPTKVFIALLLLPFLLLASCSKTVEKETEAWEKNTKKVQGMTALYPSFKILIEAQIQKASVMMDEAKTIDDKETAAKKMSEANAAIRGGIAAKLENVERLSKNVRQKTIDAAAKAVGESLRNSAEVATEEANRILDDVDKIIQQGAEELLAANALLDRAVSDLKAAEGNLDRVIKAAAQKRAEKAEKKAKKAEKKAEKNLAASGNTDNQKAAEPWKCAFCGSLNDPSVYKCKSCGAGKTEKK